MTTIVAAAQLGPASPTREETVARIVRMIREAAAVNAELVVFPELALTPYFAAAVHDDPSDYFESDLADGPAGAILSAAAAGGVAVVLPFAERQGGNFYNSATLIDAQGSEVGRFRKLHIPGQKEPAEDGSFRILEKRYFAPGDLGFPLYPSPIGRLGMLICYDRRFPEAYRCYGLAGAEVIAVGYNTPWGTGPNGAKTAAQGQEQSELAMRAGAYANGVPVIASGKAGVELGTGFIGGSLVIGPQGDVLAKAKTEGDELVPAEIDLEAAAALRGRLNLELNRRPEEYAILTRAAVPV